MEIDSILNKIEIAISLLLSNDIYLLERGLNERSISSKLAWYLQTLFFGFNVDCEYNGDADKPNDIKALEITEHEIRDIGFDPNKDNSYRISPDIIIHLRGRNDKNLVVIEIKKDISKKQYKEFDFIKLKHLTTNYLDRGNHYNYQLGIAIEFNTNVKAGMYQMSFFQNGTLTPRKNLQ